MLQGTIDENSSSLDKNFYAFTSTIPLWMIIPRDNKIRKAWEYIPIFCSIYNAILVPYEFSFGYIIEYKSFIEIFDSFIDIMFVLDMVL